MKDMLDISWTPSEWGKEIGKLELKGLGTKQGQISRVSEAFRLFDPITQAFLNRKNSKTRLMSNKHLLGCIIYLQKSGRSSPYETGKFLCVDVEANPLELLDLPIENTIAGPFAAEIYRNAIAKLATIEEAYAKAIHDVLHQFEKNDYCYKWVLKDSLIRRPDFRARIDVSESSEGLIAWLTISSEKKKISEQIEIFNQPRPHPKLFVEPEYYSQPHLLAHVDLSERISLQELRQIKITSSGIHLAPMHITLLENEMSQDGNLRDIKEDDYRITIRGRELSVGVCEALGIEK